MNILQDYTLDYLKRNRRNSLAIMVAILMVTTMLSALCGTLYTMYTDNLRLVLENSGDWHGELFDATPATDLPTIEAFDSIENILIKGQWKVAAIDDPRRDYLIWRDANADYWNYMGEKTLITEGRIPAAHGEIALSKQYFEHHPELKIGDTLTLPLGDRIAPDGTVLSPQQPAQSGEQFSPTGTAALTVVGKLDMTTSSDVPAYLAIGYLDREQILPGDLLTVYFRFHNVRDTYRELPAIAQAVGYQMDEYGQYNLRYNTAYLSRIFVFSDQQMDMIGAGGTDTLQMPIAFAVTGLLVVAVFVVIIHNAFALSANARLTQLGVLASVGATPKQIKHSVLFEAFALTVIPLPLGIFLGWLLLGWTFDYFNTVTAPLPQSSMITLTFGLPAALPAVLLTLLTVWWSALIPARRVAKLSPIAAIRQGENGNLRKPRKHSLGKLLGLPGELAANAIHARKRSYRTATLSLLLSFLVFTCLLLITSTADTSRAVYGSDTEWNTKDIDASIRVGNEPEVLDQINAIEGVADAQWYGQQRIAVWLPPQALSPEFTAAGGYEAASKLGAALPLYRDGQYRISSVMIGLDDATFSAYCADQGIDPAPYYQADGNLVILYNSVQDITTSTKRNPVHLPYLSKGVGDILSCGEQLRDDDAGNYTFQVEIGAVANALPFEEYFGGRYAVTLLLPMGRLRELAGQFDQPGNGASYANGRIQVTDPAQIPAVRAQIEALCESYFGSGDYGMLDKAEMDLNSATGLMLTNLMFGFISGLLAVIGLSNVWATISGTLHSRKRELAMLRSVGISPGGIRQMLLYEAVLLGLTPLLLALPVQLGVLGTFLYINEVTLLEWLPFAPLLLILGFGAALLAVMGAAYLLGGRQLLRQNIVDAIKDGTV